ncbi:MAG: glycoside hydrolase family 2 protein [bacterium]
MKQRLNLNGVWQLTVDWRGPNLSLLPKALFAREEWLEATVPGTVHTDLLANSKLEDPFYADNECKAQWVAEVGWVYRREFQVPETFVASPAVDLVAQGLDTFATVFLNGTKVAETDNMFIAHRFNIKEHLAAGKNDIEIHFASPLARTRELEQKHGQLLVAHERSRVYARKAQYAFGWDWGPRLATSGIWRPIYLEAYQGTRISSVFVDSQLTTALDRATVRVRAELEKRTEATLDATLTLADQTQTVSNAEHSFETTFEIDQPRLWWPSGWGSAHLYELRIELSQQDRQVDSAVLKVGMRKVELCQEEDSSGKSFTFKINNQPLFCKGANWIPADSFLPRLTPETYRQLLEQAKAANMNMVRVWGGGIYEQEIFYELCDELGLLVWQDFMFACAAYPQFRAFQDNVTREVTEAVKRLRNHPCLVLWCGNNENEINWRSQTQEPLEKMPGYALFHHQIPEICRKLDPDRPYWPSTPFGGEDPNGAEEGTRHQWNIWSGWQDFTSVSEDRSRFVTEFGFQGPANLSTLEKALPPEDRWPQSEMLEFHNKQVEGPERLNRFLSGHVKLPGTLPDFVYKGQVVQAEALKHCIEHWRMQKFHTSGSLIWQLNDCWPVISWSLIDSELQPKAAYYYVRRAFAPLLVSFLATKESIEVWAVHDTLKNLTAELRVLGLTFQGERFFQQELPVALEANTATRLFSLERRQLFAVDWSAAYLKAELFLQGRLLAENRHFLKRFKHLKLARPQIQKSLTRLNDDEFLLTLATPVFAKCVAIVSDVIAAVEDNCFDLDANIKRETRIRLSTPGSLSPEALALYSLV